MWRISWPRANIFAFGAFIFCGCTGRIQGALGEMSPFGGSEISENVHILCCKTKSEQLLLMMVCFKAVRNAWGSEIRIFLSNFVQLLKTVMPPRTLLRSYDWGGDGFRHQNPPIPILDFLLGVLQLNFEKLGNFENFIRDEKKEISKFLGDFPTWFFDWREASLVPRFQRPCPPPPRSARNQLSGSASVSVEGVGSYLKYVWEKYVVCQGTIGNYQERLLISG